MTAPLPQSTALLLLLSSLASAQVPQRVHRLPASPETVAWGYYWSGAKPVLRVASGDIVEVETLLTSTPTRLEAAGVAPAAVEASLRAIAEKVTDKGPGGHILTGPVFVEGAEPGDVLEVRILEVGFAIPYVIGNALMMFEGVPPFGRNLSSLNTWV